MKLIELNRYPVKSMGGNRLSHSTVEPSGLPLDREWLIASPEGQFITARKWPKMLLWQAEADQHGLALTAPDGSNRTITCAEMTQPAEVVVWKDRFTAWHGSAETDAWLSSQLGTPARLYWLGKPGQRVLSYSQTPLSFADGAPFLITNTASLELLNSQLEQAVEMARFRSNFVVNGNEAYAEDNWRRIRIGEVEFELFKPCIRCVMTTVDLKTGQKHPQQQPLSTLAVTHKAVFGINMIALNRGRVAVGDEVEILQ